MIPYPPDFLGILGRAKAEVLLAATGLTPVHAEADAKLLLHLFQLQPDRTEDVGRRGKRRAVDAQCE